MASGLPPDGWCADDFGPTLSATREEGNDEFSGVNRDELTDRGHEAGIGRAHLHERFAVKVRNGGESCAGFDALPRRYSKSEHPPRWSIQHPPIVELRHGVRRWRSLENAQMLKQPHEVLFVCSAILRACAAPAADLRLDHRHAQFHCGGSEDP